MRSIYLCALCARSRVNLSETINRCSAAHTVKYQIFFAYLANQLLFATIAIDRNVRTGKWPRRAAR